MKKYQTFSYGKKKGRVVLYLLRKHGKNGVGGLVAGPVFKEYIGLVVDETPCEDRDYRYACLTKFESSGMNAILMDRSVFYGFKQGDVLSRTAVFHELGHCFHGHICRNGFDTKEYAERREESVSNQAVAPEELEADAFAAKYLGAEYVSNGLRRIIESEKRLKTAHMR